jgi:tRNA A37 methylthiotransferase MiaB
MMKSPEGSWLENFFLGPVLKSRFFFGGAHGLTLVCLQAFMFAYSERSKTHASHTMADDVPEEVKLRRLQEVIDAFRETGEAASKSLIGSEHVVLVEGESKRSTKESPQMSGRNDNNKICVWSPVDVPGPDGAAITPGKGTWLRVKVVNAGRNTLYVEPLKAQATL